MSKTPALLIRLDSVKRDPALDPEGRGERKILVTELYPTSEVELASTIWGPGDASASIPVQVMGDVEMAVFTHRAAQSCHYHKHGTEIYTVVEGRMIIEVEGAEYSLKAGDSIVVNPGAVHQVLPREDEFVCTVVAVHCGGLADKYECG
ncbi:MAG TPA: cupin domain-containing protein [Terriglobia bacterium]|nr:cupin domain-containing protein [Terriglobia bacterium]